MKVCFFPHYSFSNKDGATLSMYNVIDEMVMRGIEVVVVLPNKRNLQKQLMDQRIKFIHIPMYSMRMDIKKVNFFSYIKYLYKYLHNTRCINIIKKKLRNEKIDYIHLNGLDSCVGAKVANAMGIPYVWHIRQFLGEDLGKRLFMQNETYEFVKKANAVICISEDVKKKFEVELGRVMNVVYNGIPKKLYYIEDNKIFNKNNINILFAGRISRQKGQKTAIIALEKMIASGYKNVRLTIVGAFETSDFKEEIESYINDKCLGKYISILEPADNLSELRKNSDIGLTCSRREAFGRVTVENMMSGLLVIGTDSGGTSEIIDNGRTGLLCKVDDAQDLCQKICYAIDNQDKMIEIAQNGKEEALKKYTISRVVDEILEVYKNIVLEK